VDVEGQKKPPPKPWFFGRLADRAHGAEHHASRTLAVAFNPKSWDRRAIYQSAVVAPASSLPAVCVGLLLNILDALSYGKAPSSPFPAA
jgi:SulP family sulfate permease